MNFFISSFRSLATRSARGKSALNAVPHPFYDRLTTTRSTLSKTKNTLLRDAGFRSIAHALDHNAPRTTQAIWASVNEIHAGNAARAASQTQATIPTTPSVGQRRNQS
jgi:hypothetical protein